jgi:hypothetical protein
MGIRGYRRSVLTPVVAFLFLAAGSAAFAANPPAFDAGDARYLDKFLDRTFTLQGDEALIRYEAGAAASPARGPGDCDDFDRPDTATVTGWTELPTGSWSIDTNMLLHSTEPSYHYATYDGSDMADGCVEAWVHYGTGPAVQYAGLVARYDSSSDKVLAKVQDNSNSGNFDSYHIYDGSTLVDFALGEDFGTDPIIQLQCLGAAVTFRIDENADGIWEHEYPVSVSTIDAGLCGVAAYHDTAFDDWCFGTDCGYWDAGPICESFDHTDTSAIGGWTEQAGDWSIASDRVVSQASPTWQYLTHEDSYQAGPFTAAGPACGSSASSLAGCPRRRSSSSRSRTTPPWDTSTLGG